MYNIGVVSLVNYLRFPGSALCSLVEVLLATGIPLLTLDGDLSGVSRLPYLVDILRGAVLLLFEVGRSLTRLFVVVSTFTNSA
jgi:hypothetical protein